MLMLMRMLVLMLMRMRVLAWYWLLVLMRNVAPRLGVPLGGSVPRRPTLGKCGPVDSWRKSHVVWALAEPIMICIRFSA